MNRVLPSLAGTSLGILALLVALVVTPARAAVPQTITIDGVNDFDAANLLEDDGGDTEETNFCGDDPEVDTPMDIKAVYVTNDANNLYIGFEYDRECFASPSVNLGIAFSYGAAADGGNTDPFSRKIAWNTITEKPDNVVYAVIDGFNFEVFYQWNGTGWTDVQSGSDGLGMANDTGFEELSLPLSLFTNGGISGLSGGDNLKIELWMTQDGTTKPALDALASDDAQQSTPGGTTFDVNGDPIEMTAYLDYTVLSVIDNDAPAVTGVSLVDGDASQVRVTFNEPVDPATGGNVGNYGISGTAGAISLGAAAVSSNVVVLTATAPIPGSTDLYTLAVNGVEDIAGNAAAASYDFALKDIVFEGLFGAFLQSNGTGSDFFTVEGSVEPLDFVLAEGDDQMVLFDAVEDIYRLNVPFAFFVGPNGGAATQTSRTVEWKFAFNATQFESRSNRELIIESTSDGSQVISRFWDDLDPTQFTSNDIDVVFTLDTTGLGVIPGDTVELAGSVAPLSFDPPLTAMVDDGSGQDAAAGDGIYTVVVTFPTGTLKNVNYKYAFNASLECFGQGDRSLFLNDELFDTIGGPNGPLVLPLATYDRCTALAGPAEVVFSVDINGSAYDMLPPLDFDVLVAGNVSPLSFDLGGVDDAPVLMLDDGVAPDAAAGDLIYTASVVFPDSSNRFLEYKYVVNGEFEAQGLPNRSVTLNDGDGSAQVLATDELNFTVATNVGDVPLRADRLAVKAMPNPFNPQTSIVFEMPHRADVAVEIFDARGRAVRTLHRGPLAAGEHTRVWDGRTDQGGTVGSGVYYARVSGGGFASAVRLVLVK